VKSRNVRTIVTFDVKDDHIAGKKEKKAQEEKGGKMGTLRLTIYFTLAIAGGRGRKKRPGREKKRKGAELNATSPNTFLRCPDLIT